MSKLTADDLIYGYINGIFPMADADGTLYWYAPDPRAVIPIDTYKPAKSLRPILNKQEFEIRINADFEQVMRYCSVPRSTDDSVWISEEIIGAYTELHRLGLAHSVETYLNNQLVGGLYGVAVGTAFFGESMFHHVSNASKVAFHQLILTLRPPVYVARYEVYQRQRPPVRGHRNPESRLPPATQSRRPPKSPLHRTRAGAVVQDVRCRVCTF